MREPSAIAVQFGARRQYAVPAALAQTGRLSAFYTDLCAGRGPGRIAPLITAFPSIARRVNLDRRRVPPEVLPVTRVFPRWFWDMQRALRVADNPAERLRRLRQAHEAASNRMLSVGFGGATHVVTMFGEATRLMAEARARGLVTVTDMNIAPSTEELVLTEQARFPDWEAPKFPFGQAAAPEADVPPIMDEIRATTDIYICPSEFVRDDLIRNFDVAPAATRLMPYAVNPCWLRLEQRPVPGRVLFAGGAELRKGIHVLAEAARLLAEAGSRHEIRIAGHAPAAIRTRPETRHLTFLGRLDSTQMQEAYVTADIVALPSIAEGSAGVTYEAMGCGIPVITTFEAGSPLRDGIDGRIVPARDPEALAYAIAALTTDREMRNAMGRAAREHAANLGWAVFTARLNTAIFGARQEDAVCSSSSSSPL